MHNKGECAIRHNRELLCPWADHVERSFLSNACMVQGLITTLYPMKNCIYKGFSSGSRPEQ